jgi:RNA polymerase sigma-70 factor (ECF subfamily)
MDVDFQHVALALQRPFDRTGADRPGANRPGADRTGADRTDANRTGANQIGADRIEADRTGSNRIGASPTGVDRTGRNRTDAGVTGAGVTGGGGPKRAPEGVAAEDVALILAIAGRRDRAAFVTLFGRFAPRLKAWFQRSGSASDQAEDLAQETMLAVWRKAESFDPTRAGATTWIFTIARNQRIDTMRRAPRRTLDAEDPSLAPQAPAAPDAVFDTFQRESRLREALSTLPAEQAEVIRLSFFEDRPHADIERALSIPLGTVKSRLRLAMNRLRGHLGDFGPAQTGAAPVGRGGEQP